MKRYTTWLTDTESGLAHLWVSDEYPLHDAADTDHHCHPDRVRAMRPGDTYCQACKAILAALLEQAGGTPPVR